MLNDRPLSLFGCRWMESRWPFIQMKAEKQNQKGQTGFWFNGAHFETTENFCLSFSLSLVSEMGIFGGRYLVCVPFFLGNKWCLGGSVILFRWKCSSQKLRKRKPTDRADRRISKLERERLLFHSLTNLGDGPQQEEEEEKFLDLFSLVLSVGFRGLADGWWSSETEIWGGRETEVHALAFGACAERNKRSTQRGSLKRGESFLNEWMTRVAVLAVKQVQLFLFVCLSLSQPFFICGAGGAREPTR